MNKILLFWILLGFTIHIGVCQKKNTQEESFSDITFNMKVVPDQVYWKGDQYMVDKPFLGQFSGHEKLYPELPIVEVQTYDGFRPGQKYYPIWLLQDSTLYLRTINFYVDYEVAKKIFPSYEEQYQILEKLTKHKFQKNLDNLSPEKTPVEGQLGSMKAVWVNGVYYIKTPWKYDGKTDWKLLPLEKLTFKDGKLISVETIKPTVESKEK